MLSVFILMLAFYETQAAGAGYAMYVWTNGYDINADGCDNETVFLDWDSNGPCFTHTWNTEEKRKWLWATCNLPGREVSTIYMSGFKQILKDAYNAESCVSTEIDMVRQTIKEGHTEVPGLLIYVLFAASDLAVSEQKYVKYVRYYNDHCANDAGERVDGVAVNNEAYAGIKCGDYAERIDHLDKLKNITIEAGDQLLTHFSIGWHWGKCDGALDNFTWNGKTQDANRHMIDLFDTTDIQVGYITPSAISERLALSHVEGATIYATLYLNKVEVCQTSFFPDDTCHIGDHSEAGLFEVIDSFAANGINAKPALHYFRGPYSSGAHPDWPMHNSVSSGVVDGLQPNTDAIKDYQLVPFSVKDRTSILFKVKACGHAHVLLMANASNEEDAVYEIVLGESGNTKSVVRKGFQGTMTKIAEDLNPRTACDLSKFFWIDWSGGSISVGEGELVGVDPFMSYEDLGVTPINRFMISTGSGDTGEWNLGAFCTIRGDPHHRMLDGSRYGYSGHRCWFDVLYHDDQFFITGHYELCFKQKSCLKEVSITYKDVNIRLKKGDTVEVNGNSVNAFPHSIPEQPIEVTLNEADKYRYTVELPNAVLLRWDGKRDLKIEVGMSFINNVKGMCGGNYNLQKADDFTLRNGTVLKKKDSNIFAKNFAILSESTTNLALGKDVSQSSLYNGNSVYAAQTAIDNCTNMDFFSNCHCACTIYEYNPWWKIDMGEVTTINRIKIYRRSDCEVCERRMNGFRIFVTQSDDITAHEPVYTETVDRPGPLIDIDLGWEVGRYVTIDIPNRNEYLTLCEVQIYGDDQCILV